MNKGYRYLAAGAGFMLIAGFILPWLGKNPFHFSGVSFAMLGYGFLGIIPLSGAAVIFFALVKDRPQPGYLLYPCMAALLTFVLMISFVVFSDSGALGLNWPSGTQDTLRLKQGENLILLNPVKDMGMGAILNMVGMGLLFALPLMNQGVFQETRNQTRDSYKQILGEPKIQVAYKRFGQILALMVVLAITYAWCGISPGKLWENRGNARDYLFGRKLSPSDMAYVNGQKARAAQIEASGRAEEVMSNKYRKIPYSKQPSPQEKAKERAALRQEFLSKISQAERICLGRAAKKNALKEKKGGYFPPETSPIKIKGYLVALVETIAIAVWGTMLALVCAIPVSFFAAKNTLALIISSDDLRSRSLRTSITFGVRRFLDSCRGFNEFVMALIFVAVIGLGPYAGILALWIHTFGVLGKVFSEQIEAIESGQVEALTSTGANPVQTIVFSVMPQVLPGLVSYTLLRFESNVRSAAILGFVGAGGIGFLIFDKLNGYLFREVCTMMIIIIMTVGIIDHFCGKIRMKFI